FWWERLLKDPWYAAKVNCRWQELRSSTLSQQHIYQMIDNYVQTMGGGVDRNFQQWPILTQYVWPNNYVGNTYPNEIRYLKDWINRRLQWMDANMPGDCYSLTALENPEEGLILYPNPTSEVIQVGLADDPAATFDITLYTLSGVEVLQQAALCNGEALSIRHLPPGIYLVHLSVNGKQVVRKIRIVR
ncbi:MAG: CotH kinase family protein, partial [Cyclobacteriaceae bacterium]|nr:CotH kinase family protein [Cyclobacteriaceae bacterium]